MAIAIYPNKINHEKGNQSVFLFESVNGAKHRLVPNGSRPGSGAKPGSATTT